MINPNDNDAFYNRSNKFLKLNFKLGIAVTNLNRNQNAIECYDQAIKINRKQIDKIHNKGNLFFKTF